MTTISVQASVLLSNRIELFLQNRNALVQGRVKHLVGRCQGSFRTSLAVATVLM